MHNNIIRTNGIYLDACSTTPPHQRVIEKIKNVELYAWGNPSSIHKVGIDSSLLLERSRQIFSEKLRAPISDLIFTSGATESINLAIKGVCGSIGKGRIVISNVEHPAVTAAAISLISDGWDLQFWPVDELGRIKLNLLEEMLSPPTKFVSLIWGQSEIGAIQPISIIGKECRERGIYFHTDATQILPHGLFNWDEIPVDLLSASGHKMQGPKGIGLFMYRSNKNTSIKPIIHGGQQEKNLRSGTQAVALAAGFAESLSLVNDYIKFDNGYASFIQSNVSLMTEDIKKLIKRNLNLKLTGPTKYRLPNHLSFIASTKSNSPINSRKLVRDLSNRGVYISTGTACKSGRDEVSSILKSIGIEQKFQKSGIRLSLGPWIIRNQLDHIKTAMIESIRNYDSNG